jgi:hypothetical protein
VSALADRLDAQATRLEAEAAQLRAEADSLRSNVDDTLVTKAAWPSDLRVTFRTVRDAAGRGELEGLRAGRSPAFRRRDVVHWLESRALTIRVASAESDEVLPKTKAARRALVANDYQAAIGGVR